MKKRMLVIAAAVTATMMMTCPVMADDFKVGICNYVDSNVTEALSEALKYPRF